MDRHEGSTPTGETRPCPACRKKGKDRSGDNLVMFDDGHGFCFACKHYHQDDGTKPVKVERKVGEFKPVSGKVGALEHRGITAAVCKLFGYRQANITKLGPVEVADYCEPGGKLVAQHVRLKNKDFRWKGERYEDEETGRKRLVPVPLFGQHLWRSKGKRIIVTEGEIDAMTVYQILGERWPVVSLPNGAADADNAIRRASEFLSGYDEIVLCFDNDEAGQDAALECAEILPPGKVKIVTLPRKDANAMLLKGEQKALTNCLWEAQTFRPDGIIHLGDAEDEHGDSRRIYPFPWRCLTKGLLGQRSHEMTMWTSGTGMGKSTILRHIILHHLQHGRTVGVCMLEEDPTETRDDMISIMIGKPVRQIRAARELNAALADYNEEAIDFEVTDDLTEEEYDEARRIIRKWPIHSYNHRGAKDYDGIIDKIEYMVVGLGCDVVVLDHVTAVIAGTNDMKGGERRGIDELMLNLRSLISRTGVHLDVVSQLKKPDGKPFEEGGRISSSHLRGSGSLASVPNTIIAIERNQQDSDKERANTILVRALKGRFNGRTGLVGALRYDNATANFKEVEWHEQPDGNVSFGPRSEYMDDDDGTETSGPAGDFTADGGSEDAGGGDHPAGAPGHEAGDGASHEPAAGSGQAEADAGHEPAAQGDGGDADPPAASGDGESGAKPRTRRTANRTGGASSGKGKGKRKPAARKTRPKGKGKLEGAAAGAALV